MAPFASISIYGLFAVVVILDRGIMTFVKANPELTEHSKRSPELDGRHALLIANS